MLYSFEDLIAAFTEKGFQLNIRSPSNESMEDAKLRRLKDLISFTFANLSVFAILMLCGYIVLSNQFSATVTDGAITLCSTILSGFFGFLAGRKIGH